MSHYPLACSHRVDDEHYREYDQHYCECVQRPRGAVGGSLEFLERHDESPVRLKTCLIARLRHAARYRGLEQLAIAEFSPFLRSFGDAHLAEYGKWAFGL